MNNRSNNFYNENTFTWDESKQSNEKMEEVYNYCKKQIDDYKSGIHNQTVAAASPADELKKFKELLDMGVVSQEEFDAKKKQILGL